jgi:aspartate/methionine/tyrosine aminotransferase
MLSIEPGDEVIIQVPTWPQVQYLAEGFGAKVIPFELQFEENWAPNFECLKSLVTSKTRLIIISYPSNPTGYVLNRKELEAYSNIAEDSHARLLNDETYKFLEWEGSVSPSACEVSDEAITTGTLSKTFAAVGVRIGWIVSRDETFIQRSKDLHFYTTLQNNNLGEYIGTRLLERWNELLPRNRELGKHNLAILSSWMKEHEKWMHWVKPKGSTVCFPRFNIQLTSTEFCEGLLKKQKALSAPGRTFWPTYDKHIRLGFSKNTKTFVKGLERLSAYLNSFEN